MISGQKQRQRNELRDRTDRPSSQETTDAPEQRWIGDASTLSLSIRERLALLDQLGMMLESGIQIPAALQSMREQSVSPKIGAILGHMEDAVRSGRPLATAIDELPRAFPETVKHMLGAGEKAGRLGEMLEQVSEMTRAEEELRGRLRSALMYPAVMIVVAFSVVVFLLTTIVPKFSGLFKGKEDTLPGPTKVLMWLSEFLSGNLIWLLPTVVVVVGGTFFYLRSAQGKPHLDRILLGTPVIKEIYRMAIISRTSRTLGMLSKAGVVILAALEHTRDVSGSPAFAKLWSQVHHEVANGGTISEAIRTSPLLPPTYKQLIGSAESAARLDVVLLRIAKHYSQELQRKVHDLTTLIEPALVVFMGVVVGFIALSIMLPIFKLSQNA